MNHPNHLGDSKLEETFRRTHLSQLLTPFRRLRGGFPAGHYHYQDRHFNQFGHSNQMEHLPPVTKPHDPIFIPFIADSDYDGLNLAGYPSRRGFDLDRLLKGNFQISSSDQIAAFLQTWLYFGLMHAILGVKLKTADFVRTDESGKKWLTTEKLPKFLHVIGHFAKKEKTMPEYTEEYVQTRNSRLFNAFRLSHDVWEAFSKLEDRYSIPNPMSPEVAFGIQVLAITLHVGATEICGGPPGQPSCMDVPWEKGRHWRLTRSRFMDERMIAHGWCPTVVKQVWSQCNPVGQYYSSLLGPPHRKLDHSACSPNEKDCAAMKQLLAGKITHEKKKIAIAVFLLLTVRGWRMLSRGMKFQSCVLLSRTMEVPS